MKEIVFGQHLLVIHNMIKKGDLSHENHNLRKRIIQQAKNCKTKILVKKKSVKKIVKYEQGRVCVLLMEWWIVFITYKLVILKCREWLQPSNIRAEELFVITIYLRPRTKKLIEKQFIQMQVDWIKKWLQGRSYL